MNSFEVINEIITYIENHLDHEINFNTIGKKLGYSSHHLQRLFLMMTNIPPSEYIRNRRLASAAYDLMDKTNTVTEVSYKYQYSSPTSFNRAFKKFHGIPPKDIKNPATPIKAYPPLRFEMSIKGATPIDYRIETTESFYVVGKRLTTSITDGRSYREIPEFWQVMTQDNAIEPLLPLMSHIPFGILGVSNYNPNLNDTAFHYYIGVSSSKADHESLDVLKIQKTQWAIFTHPMGSPEQIQSYQHSIVTDWLPTSGFQFGIGPDIEVYSEEGSLETWIPITKKTL